MQKYMADKISDAKRKKKGALQKIKTMRRSVVNFKSNTTRM